MEMFHDIACAVSPWNKGSDFNLDFLKNARPNVPGLRCLACRANRDFPLTGSESHQDSFCP